MTGEIEFLAAHDKGFNDAYNEYFSNKKQLFGLPDDQIITSRESLVWKIYAKKAEEKKNDDKISSPKRSNVGRPSMPSRYEAHKPSPIGKPNF